MKTDLLLHGAFWLLLPVVLARSEISVIVAHNSKEDATSSFTFKTLPSPSDTDAATRASFSVVDGERDENGGGLEILHDGRWPREADQPSRNFFFNAGTKGGRLLIDLRIALELKQINTYSWHPTSRSSQVYRLFASDGKSRDFKSSPKGALEPEKCGWKLIANVDTRSQGAEKGGQYGVSITSSNGGIGKFRYVLLDIKPAETDDEFGNTFFSEIDVVSTDPLPPPYFIRSKDRSCEIAIDTFEAPELDQWATNSLAPVLAEWYPKIVAMLPSEGYTAPKAFRVLIKPGRGVAATSGTNVTANSTWLQRELKGEAIGAILHEEVHVIQQYGWGRRRQSASPGPGWLTEGIPDYIRWFNYEPQSHGADVVWLRRRPNVNLRHDLSYRFTANFLNYVVEKHDRNLIQKLNAACRQGSYEKQIWKDATGKTIDELNEEWVSATRAEITKETSPTIPAQ